MQFFFSLYNGQRMPSMYIYCIWRKQEKKKCARVYTCVKYISYLLTLQLLFEIVSGHFQFYFAGKWVSISSSSFFFTFILASYIQKPVHSPFYLQCNECEPKREREKEREITVNNCGTLFNSHIDSHMCVCKVCKRKA